MIDANSDGGRERNTNVDHLFTFLRKYPLFPSIAMLRSQEARLFARLNLQEPILDLGCGNGFFTHVVLGRVHSGIDRDFVQARRAQASSAYQHTVVGDICKLPYKNESFSTVFSNCVLEHVENLGEALAEICRVLAPGGSCLITVPTNKFDEWFYLSWLLRKLGMPRLAKKQNDRYNRFQFQFHVYTVEEWSAKLAKANLKLDSWRPYGSQAFLFLFSAIDDIQHVLGHLLIKKASSSEGCATAISERFSGGLLGNLMAHLLRPLLLPFHGEIHRKEAGGAAVLLHAKKSNI